MRSLPNAAIVFRFYAYRTWAFEDESSHAEVVLPMEESSRVPDDRS